MCMERDIILRFTVTISLLISVVSCSDNSASDVTGPVEDVSYMNDIQLIFNGSCGGAGCHIESSQSGVSLSSYDNVMNSIGQQYEREIVEAGNPDESPLVDKIEPEPQHGERMPFGRNPLNDRQIEEIRIWIEEGAMDN